ncbi:MAG: peroxiredoxin family protein [Nitrospirales bacterium]
MKLGIHHALAAVAVVAVLLIGGLDQMAWSMGERPPVQGMPAPDFTLQTLRGENRSLSDYEGKIVLLNFWATWCKPCTKEMPAMEAAYQTLRDQDFVVLAVNELEDEDKVRKHVEQHGHTFPVLLDRDNRVANQYGVYGLPVTVFIDETGRVRDYIKGGLLTEEKIEEVVQRIRSTQKVPAGTAS